MWWNGLLWFSYLLHEIADFKEDYFSEFDLFDELYKGTRKFWAKDLKYEGQGHSSSSRAPTAQAWGPVFKAQLPPKRLKEWEEVDA
jgi:hypothetical protein